MRPAVHPTLTAMNNPEDENQQRVVPVLQEELVADKHVVTTGAVRVQKHVDRQTKNVSMPLVRETVDVRRVPVNRIVETAPVTRTVGDTTIIPVVEEELVVTKRLILKEEIHLTKTRSRENTTQEVTLEKESAEVMRLDADGRVVNKSAPRRRSILS